MSVGERHGDTKSAPGDIAVATAAKAGTTWMQPLVFQQVHEGAR